MKTIRKGVCAPGGFKAGAVCSGIKKKRPDLALIFSESPAASAGLFTTNRFKAAPVLLAKRYLGSALHRAVFINAGNANCLTGREGLNDAASIGERLSAIIGCKRQEVLMCSTGKIGVRLPVGRIKRALPSLALGLSNAGSSKAAEAIMTTDTFRKEAALVFKFKGREVRIGGIAKGAGMIEPNLATMLCVVTTDIRINKALLASALKEAVDGSFNSITVDGDMSTNDTVLILANGASGVDAGSSKALYKKFVSALSGLCLELAGMIVKDGEGATKFITIEVKRARSRAHARSIALAIANSSLFKTMCYGEDPNFGRIASACGAHSADIVPSKVSIHINGREVLKNGTALRQRPPRLLMKRRKIDVMVGLNMGRASGRILTSDLSPEYIKINAEYS